MTASAAPLVGSATPRLWTPPLCELTPATSKGFQAVQFAEAVGVELMPWQRWALIHGLELRPDGGFRFRTVLVLVARQAGKSTLAGVLALWRMVMDDQARLVLGTSSNLDVARESWLRAIELVEGNAELSALFNRPRHANGQEELSSTSGARYKLAAANRRGGRGLSVDLGIADELREHVAWDAWSALSATTIARPNSQIWALSNAGGDESVVLNTLRAAALSGDAPDLGIMEWSADPELDIADRRGWVQANPSLGITITESTLEGKLATAPPAVFKTEHLCMRVASLSGAVDMASYAACLDPSASLDGLRDRVALCVDVATDNRHVSLVAAAVGTDGRVIVEPVAAWPTPDDARRDLPGWLERVKPYVFGWFPGGPGAALAADMRPVAADAAVAVKFGLEPGGAGGAVELKGAAVNEACMGFAESVAALRVRHAGDPLLTTHVGHAERMKQGDAWRFCRPAEGQHIDAAYAAAGAVHLARTVPVPEPVEVFVLRV